MSVLPPPLAAGRRNQSPGGRRGSKQLTKPTQATLVNDNPFPTPPDAAIDFVLPLSRPGSFVLWAKATDRVTKKSTEFETTFHVSEP